MPASSRRSHTKSRRGCFQCKRRHVKCDEELPRCSLCQKRGLGCDYPPESADGQAPITSGKSVGVSASLTTTLTTSPPTESWSEPIRMLEMKLFHHYVVDASFTLRQDLLEAGYFQVAVPKLATSNPYLLDILMAFSALHFAFLGQGDSKWLEIALKYQNRACSAFSRVLVDLAPEALGPAFICSIFIMLCAFAYPCVSANRETFDPLKQVLEIHRLLVGCAFLFQQLGNVELPEEMKAWLVYKSPEVFREKGQVEDAQLDAELEQIQRDLLKSLDRLHTTIDNTNTAHTQIYQSTWDVLTAMIKEWPRGKRQGGILAFPVYLSEEFMARLEDEEDDWIARMLFLHYGVGMHLLSNKWYVGIWGRRLVGTVLQMLEESREVPDEWKGTVGWARRAVAYTVPYDGERVKEKSEMGLC